MNANAIKTVIGFGVSVIAVMGMLTEFDKMPGPRLGAEKARFALGFGAKESGRGSGVKESGGNGAKGSESGGPKQSGRDSSKESRGYGAKAFAGRLTRNDDLRLHSLFRAGRHALAIINNQTFAEGDVASVDFRGENIQLRCEKIGTNSVLVSGDRLTGTVELFPDGRRTNFELTGSGNGVLPPAPR